jgi:hypothetical protein
VDYDAHLFDSRAKPEDPLEELPAEKESFKSGTQKKKSSAENESTRGHERMNQGRPGFES